MAKISSKTQLLLGGAVMAVGVVALGASQAQASVMFDVRLAGTNDHQTTVGGPGTAVNFDVFAVVQGANGLTTDEGFQSAEGSLISVGGAHGTLSLTLDPAFAGPGSNPGKQGASAVDVDGDGDLDVGTGTAATQNGTAGLIVFRAPAVVPGTALKIGTGTFMPSSNGAANVQFRVAPASLLNKNPSWLEDATTKNASSGTVAASVPLVVTVGQVVVGRKATIGAPPGDAPNVATGGAVVVTGSNGKYVSEIDPLTDNVQAGSVTINGINDPGLLYVLAGLTGTPADIGTALADPALTQGGAQVITSGPEFDALKVHYPFMNALFKYTNFAGGPVAFSFDFGNGVQLDNVAAVPEPTTLGLFAAAGLGLLARRRRRA